MGLVAQHHHFRSPRELPRYYDRTFDLICQGQQQKILVFNNQVFCLLQWMLLLGRRLHPLASIRVVLRYAQGRPTGPYRWLWWNGGYHNGRAMIECIGILGRLAER